MLVCFGFVLKTVLRDVLTIAEQCLQSIMAFSALHTVLPASRLGVHKELGGDTAETADLN